MPDEPIAWLIRETYLKNGGAYLPRVMAGKIFVTEEAALAAAARMTNRYWTREAFPVFEPTLAQLEQCRR